MIRERDKLEEALRLAVRAAYDDWSLRVNYAISPGDYVWAVVSLLEEVERRADLVQSCLPDTQDDLWCLKNNLLGLVEGPNRLV